VAREIDQCVRFGLAIGCWKGGGECRILSEKRGNGKLKRIEKGFSSGEMERRLLRFPSLRSIFQKNQTGGKPSGTVC